MGLVRQSLVGDSYEPVKSAATAGRAAKTNQLSPAQKMKMIVDNVVAGTGGGAGKGKISNDAVAVAKRLSNYWKRWTQEESLNDVDAINTDDPRTNKGRMRAVAMGVAVARGWLVPTKDGMSLMQKNLADLDAAAAGKSGDDDDN